ncbi:hypothetical protein AOL_s00043g265 [Orbilia oligospora ATCC 24927]|uniref:H-type lectin domain-containing protein n=1 Tax=Arthrobotrys oligospora (strain ATCC 24927 / CBS 115.81 / DSM 1491) TaxID=756982 RepID=G1X3J2_ARTOA|nr:hypothetical protein AOL_s00043g265 [Orbilia oligospora ATCC 24927]EGX52476.1 hypothetical protein AOL_s00043g265 [Orbilia oligospora ATCC 24927]
MSSTPGSSGKQPIPNMSSWNGEGSSSAATPSQEDTANGNSKASVFLAAAPRLPLQEDDSLLPPSYDDANSIRSGFLPAQPSTPQENLGVGIQDALEFEYAFQIARAHEELATSVVRHVGSKTTVLAIQRLALGPHRPNTQVATVFKLNAVPLAANQLEVTAKSNSEMAMRSIKIGMLDIADDDPDLQSGVIDWLTRGTGPSSVVGTELPDVFFERPYSIPPDILMFLHAFAFRPNAPRRVRASTIGIGQQGFHPKMATGTNPLVDAKATWIAVPKDSMRFDCGTFEVTSKSGPAASMPTFTGTVQFTKWKFPKKQPPKVFIGLTGFDRDVSRPFRYSVAVTGVSHKGFSWAVRNWDETLMSYTWGAVISWIATANPSVTL